MINRQAIIVVVAAAAAMQSADAFVVPSPRSFAAVQPTPTSLFSSVEEGQMQETEDQISVRYDQVAAAAEEAKPIMDIPPMPVQAAEEKAAAAPKKAAAAAAPKKKGNPHKEGVFSPIVIAAGAVLGQEQLNKIRGKVIAIHSDLIKSFVETSDSAFGKAVLKQLFNLVDTDNSGYLDREEVAVALNLLGFKWLGEKQVEKIFERADANGDNEISLEEFMAEAPKTLKTNLVKLAKTNGGDMGLLV